MARSTNKQAVLFSPVAGYSMHTRPHIWIYERHDAWLHAASTISHHVIPCQTRVPSGILIAKDQAMDARWWTLKGCSVGVVQLRLSWPRTSSDRDSLRRTANNSLELARKWVLPCLCRPFSNRDWTRGGNEMAYSRIDDRGW